MINTEKMRSLGQLKTFLDRVRLIGFVIFTDRMSRRYTKTRKSGREIWTSTRFLGL